MKTITITSKEYAELHGLVTQRWVNECLSKGVGLPFMLSFRKSGGTWLIDVLKSWYDSKK
jgi:hypothetical protein